MRIRERQQQPKAHAGGGQGQAKGQQFRARLLASEYSGHGRNQKRFL